MSIAPASSGSVVVSDPAMTRRGQPDVFSPAFVVSGLLGSYALLAVADNLTGAYSASTSAIAFAYLVAFSVFFSLGFLTRIGGGAATALPRIRCQFSALRLTVLTAIMLPAGLALFWLLVRTLGISSPFGILANLMMFREGSGKAGTEYLLFTAVFLIEAPFWAWTIRGHVGKSGRLALAAYWLLILAVSILTGARVRVYSALMGLAFVFHHRIARITVRKAILVGMLAIVPIAMFYRLQGRVRGEAATKDAVVEAASGLQVGQSVAALAMRVSDAYDGFLTIIENRHRVDYLWGKSFRDAIYLPIPRAWVPDKPSAFNYQMLHQLAPEAVGLFFGAEYSLLGELYVNFQLGGVIVGAFLFGIVICALNTYYLSNRDSPGFLFVYRALFLSLPMAWMSSGIINSEAHAILLLNLFFGLPFVALARVPNGPMLAVRRRNPPTAERPSPPVAHEFNAATRAQ